MPFDSFGAVDQDTRTLRAAMTVPPPPGRLWQIDQTIRQLKQHGIWQKLDVLWMLAAHDAQAARLNWKNPSQFALTAVNSPTFTSDRGYAGNGSTSYLNTGWTPSTNAVNYKQDDACLGVYINAGSNSQTDSVQPFGSLGGGGGNGGFIVAWASGIGSIRGRVNQTTTNSLISAVGTRYGFSTLDRASSGTYSGYRGGASVGSSATVSAGLPNQPFYIGALNNGGAANGFSDNRIAAALAGASLTAAQHAALYRITQNHLASMGAAV